MGKYKIEIIYYINKNQHQQVFKIMSSLKILFVASKVTTLQGKNWRCAKVPCKVISNDGTNIKLLPFNSKPIHVSTKIFENEFDILENDDAYVYTPYYPGGRISISEFYIVSKSINKLKKHFKDKKNILKAIEKAEQDSYHSKGNQFCATIEEYNNYKENPKTSKLERIGDPIFNRSVRHSPPISKKFTREDFEKSASYPAPIGIREEDFALPSEQNEILTEMLNQLFSCKNAPECPEEIRIELGLNIIPNSHNCLWCGEIIDISELNQEYCSKEHSINFCHRDPEQGTKRGNVYIGHCSCNREQGGYSEEDRIEQIIRLAKNNPSYREKILRELI
jgi:hypothetical protein